MIKSPYISQNMANRHLVTIEDLYLIIHGLSIDDIELMFKSFLVSVYKTKYYRYFICGFIIYVVLVHISSYAYSGLCFVKHLKISCKFKFPYMVK
jgi:hypothetical protein